MKSKVSSHTPGSWRLMNSHKAGFLNVYTTHDCASSPDSTATDFICEIGPGARVEGELNQNAKLIAAAPDLLEACKSLLAACVANYLPGIPEIDDAQAEALKAIQRAESN